MISGILVWLLQTNADHRYWYLYDNDESALD